MSPLFKVQAAYEPISDKEKVHYDEPKYFKSPDKAASFAADALKRGARTVYLYPYEIITED